MTGRLGSSSSNVRRRQVRPARRLEERVDHGVSGDDDVGGFDVLAQQMLARQRRRRKMIGGDRAGEPSIHLLG